MKPPVILPSSISTHVRKSRRHLQDNYPNPCYSGKGFFLNTSNISDLKTMKDALNNLTVRK
jgi:hypothetical protein